MTVLCIRYIPVTLEGQKELDPPELKLQMIVSWNQSQFSRRAANARNCLAVSTALHFSSSVGPGDWAFQPLAAACYCNLQTSLSMRIPKCFSGNSVPAQGLMPLALRYDSSQELCQ